MNPARAFAWALAILGPAIGSHAGDSNPAGMLPAPGIPGAAKTGPRPTWQFGAARLRPHANYSVTYSDGLLSRPGQSTNSYIYSYSAGIGTELGDTWSFDYTPTWTEYSNRDFNGSLGHLVTASGKTSFGDTSIRFAQVYGYSSEILFETGRQTIQESSNTSFGIAYRLGSRAVADFAALASLEFMRAAPDPADYSVNGSLRYQLSSRLTASAGAAFGYVAIDPGPDMTYLRPNLQLNWQPTQKLGLGINVGSENRKFYGHAGATVLNSPTLGASWGYAPFEHTTFSATASEGVSTSYFTNQLTRNESWTLGAGQRFLGHFNVDATLSGGATRFVGSSLIFIPFAVVEEVVDEEGNVGEITTTGFTANGVTIKRKDSFHRFNIVVSTTLLKHLSASASYERRRNISNAVGFGTSVDQYSFSVGAKL